jgi:hypothetical protein
LLVWSKKQRTDENSGRKHFDFYTKCASFLSANRLKDPIEANRWLKGVEICVTRAIVRRAGEPQLLEHTNRVGLFPFGSDFVVFEVIHVDATDGDLLSRRWNALKGSLMRHLSLPSENCGMSFDAEQKSNYNSCPKKDTSPLFIYDDHMR